MKALALVLALTCMLHAQTDSGLMSVDDVRKQTDTIMGLFDQGQAEQAVDLALKYPSDPTKIVETKQKFMQGFTDVLDKIKTHFGDSQGINCFAIEKSGGESLLRLFYLQKFKTQFVVWRVAYYKPDDRWLTYGISCQVKSESQEALELIPQSLWIPISPDSK